jgi:hypothetical protein
MHLANLTDSLCPYVSNLGERKKGDTQQNVKKCKRVTKRSAAVWRLPPSVLQQQFYCALSANNLRTANRWQCAPQHREIFWCQVVGSSFSSPGVACDNCPVWSSSHSHPQKPFLITLKSRCLQTSIFVAAHLISFELPVCWGWKIKICPANQAVYGADFN